MDDVIRPIRSIDERVLVEHIAADGIATDRADESIPGAVPGRADDFATAGSESLNEPTPRNARRFSDECPSSSSCTGRPLGPWVRCHATPICGQ